MKTIHALKALGMLSVLGLFTINNAFADVRWSRISGEVKGINGKTQELTVRNVDGDDFIVKVDADVLIAKGKKDKEQEVQFKEVKRGDLVTLIFMPRPPVPKETDEPTEGGVYPPMKR